ncbi:hypothetical protein HHL16_17545 [Pseudoflavitalea sp. G-6-1-2]|uniref:hypothetical protein n=1 Tax=Pseudoflavitalea sp. G-6-1-2 TaxID=2728841 RepID=UPI00146D1CD8|nr:hypothetical protein [Pseudoflavitalea sp. G-6-1-2]NML22692.1 hypothetical protein [Pseudoflavitalea sp. G-6-1-2]
MHHMTLSKFIAGIAMLFTFNAATAQQQDLIRQQSCDISGYTSTIDSIKQFYGDRGFSLLREASMTMESEYEMPILMPMQQGTWYQFVFIGDPTSRLYEVRMYDYSEKEVFYKQNKWGDVDGNIINFDYVPKFTEMHMIKPVQVNKKKKKLCGYVMLFKRTAPAANSK